MGGLPMISTNKKKKKKCAMNFEGVGATLGRRRRPNFRALAKTRFNAVVASHITAHSLTRAHTHMHTRTAGEAWSGATPCTQSG